VEGDGEVLSDELIQLLVQELRYPPAIASLWLVAYALERRAELVVSQVGCLEQADAEERGCRSAVSIGRHDL
jgi:hypothetical protein